MRKQITVTVHRYQDSNDWYTTWKTGSAIHYSYIQETLVRMFGDTPDHYKVIYKLNPKGDLLYQFGGVDDRLNQSVTACFLKELGWDGMRVSRKVVPL